MPNPRQAQSSSAALSSGWEVAAGEGWSISAPSPPTMALASLAMETVPGKELEGKRQMLSHICRLCISCWATQGEADTQMLALSLGLGASSSGLPWDVLTQHCPPPLAAPSSVGSPTASLFGIQVDSPLRWGSLQAVLS